MAGQWVPVPRGCEGLEVLSDGTIKLSTLRAMGKTYRVYTNADDSAGGVPEHIHRIVTKKIRVTLAIPLDHRTRAMYKLTGTPGNMPTGPIQSDATQIQPGVVRQHYTHAGENIKKWIRRNSWPVLESIFTKNGDPTPKATDALGSVASPALRDDTPYLNMQAARRLGDVGRSGGEKSIFLKGIVLSIKPGDMIASITPQGRGHANVGKCVKEVILHTGTKTQSTELVLT